MVYKVYIDILLLLNFIINYLLLCATARVSGVELRRWRVTTSAILGSIYCLIAFVHVIFSALWIKLLVAIIMTVTAFGTRAWKKTVRLFFVFCGVSFAFGGVAFAINYMSGGGSMQNGIFYIKIPLGALLISASISYMLVACIFKRSATGVSENKIVKVELTYKGQKTLFYAMTDTGNTLSDPMTNAPVIVVEYESIAGLFDKETQYILRHFNEEEAMLRLQKNFRLIPFKTVDGGGFLLAFKPDEILVENARRNALIAICQKRISDGGAYTALIGIQEG